MWFKAIAVMQERKCRIVLTVCTALLISTIWADDTWGELPPGVPSPINPDGRFTRAINFTTKAYQEAAFRLVVQEANMVARELGLPEDLPITESNLVGAFISPFGYAYVSKKIGNVTTKRYTYYVSQGNKFSYLEHTHQAEECRKFQRAYTWPLTRINTNEAYLLATQWLAAVSMDVAALNRECSVKVTIDTSYVRAPAGKFVPIYYISWTRNEDGVGVASMRIFTPTKTLLQLRVEDPKYILRKPLVFTNLDVLLTQTNAPAITNAHAIP